MAKLEKTFKKSSGANFVLTLKKSISTNEIAGAERFRGGKNTPRFAVDTQLGNMVY